MCELPVQNFQLNTNSVTKSDIKKQMNNIIQPKHKSILMWGIAYGQQELLSNDGLKWGLILSWTTYDEELRWSFLG